tara:strand:+ start:1836 stop:2015 length:180 start_codon:yes stop_codon:yes gene_type:complete
MDEYQLYSLFLKNKQMENTNDPLETFKKRMEEFNKPEAVARRKEIEEYLKQVGIDFNLI